MKTAINIKSISTLAEDTFFHLEITHNGENAFEIVSAATLAELVKRSNVEVTYDEEFETAEGETIEQALENAKLSTVEIDDFETDGEFDVIFHKATIKHGEITYDRAGEFVQSYKTLAAAQRKAASL